MKGVRAMPGFVGCYIRVVDSYNRKIGRAVMYLIFVMAGVLLYSSISRAVFDRPLIWVVEVAQFLLAAYYLLGGAYSMQTDSHVRMDLLYGRWTPRARAVADVLTATFLLFYLVVLLVGGVSSAQYALEYGQKHYSAWAPPLAPVKIMMCVGIFMMLAQVISVFLKDLANALGRTW